MDRPIRPEPCCRSSLRPLRRKAETRLPLMLFADSVLVAVQGAGVKLVPVGPPNRYEEVASHPDVTLMACKPCVDVRGLAGATLDRRIKLGGMNDFHAAAKGADARLMN